MFIDTCVILLIFDENTRSLKIFKPYSSFLDEMINWIVFKLQGFGVGIWKQLLPPIFRNENLDYKPNQNLIFHV